MAPNSHFATQEKELEIIPGCLLKTLMFSAVKNRHARLNLSTRMKDGGQTDNMHIAHTATLIWVRGRSLQATWQVQESAAGCRAGENKNS